MAQVSTVYLTCFENYNNTLTTSCKYCPQHSTDMQVFIWSSLNETHVNDLACYHLRNLQGEATIYQMSLFLDNLDHTKFYTNGR